MELIFKFIYFPNACVMWLKVRSLLQAADWAKVRPIIRTKPTRPHKVVRNGDRIIGGDLATTGQFKYQVALVSDGIGFCGGSLIADNVVLSAAHCVDGY
jgi:hypothetical protein